MELTCQLHVPAALTQEKDPPGNHWIGDWMDRRAGLNTMKCRKTSYPDRPALSPSLYRLSSPGPIPEVFLSNLCRDNCYQCWMFLCVFVCVYFPLVPTGRWLESASFRSRPPFPINKSRYNHYFIKEVIEVEFQASNKISEAGFCLCNLWKSLMERRKRPS
jgi:hypothetical protein